MRIALAEGEVTLTPEAALQLWTDVSRWPSFVEGFARVIELDPGWPEEGSRAIWESVPAGRGRVTEKVAVNNPTRFATKVYEDRLYGTQTAVFKPDPEGGAQVRLTLEYELTGANAFNAVTDLLFIRRALRDALARTLGRFAVEAQEQAGLR